MKLNYSKQLTVSFCIVILFSVLTTIFKHWIFYSVGYGVVGLLWIIHPVMINDKAPTRKDKTIIRIAGVVLILVGIFTRAYLY